MHTTRRSTSRGGGSVPTGTGRGPGDPSPSRRTTSEAALAQLGRLPSPSHADREPVPAGRSCPAASSTTQPPSLRRRCSSATSRKLLRSRSHRCPSSSKRARAVSRSFCQAGPRERAVTSTIPLKPCPQRSSHGGEERVGVTAQSPPGRDWVARLGGFRRAAGRAVNTASGWPSPAALSVAAPARVCSMTAQ